MATRTARVCIQISSGQCAPTAGSPYPQPDNHSTPIGFDLTPLMGTPQWTPRTTRGSVTLLTLKPRGIMDRIELDIFSGLPNPVWDLNTTETASLIRQIKNDQTEVRPLSESSDRLGYKGFIIHMDSQESYRSGLGPTQLRSAWARATPTPTPCKSCFSAEPKEQRSTHWLWMPQHLPSKGVLSPQRAPPTPTPRTPAVRLWRAAGTTSQALSTSSSGEESTPRRTTATTMPRTGEQERLPTLGELRGSTSGSQISGEEPEPFPNRSRHCASP